MSFRLTATNAIVLYYLSQTTPELQKIGISKSLQNQPAAQRPAFIATASNEWNAAVRSVVPSVDQLATNQQSICLKVSDGLLRMGVRRTSIVALHHKEKSPTELQCSNDQQSSYCHQMEW